LDYQKKKDEWPGLKSIGVVNTFVAKNGRKYEEQRFYITLLPANARLLNNAAHAYWGIENSLHRRLDVFFKERLNLLRLSFME
jgi:predicted transposase YbfD/YdcC